MAGSKTPDSAGSPRWQRRPEARPEEILDAALEVFGAHGYSAARLEEVAQRAGVSKGTLYLYFESKEALFREMVRARVVPAVAEAEELLKKHDGSARELLEQVIRRMWVAVRDPRLAQIGRLVVGELGNFPELARFYYEEVALRSRRLMDAVLQRGVSSGEFRPVANRFAARAIPSLLMHSAQTQCFFAQLDNKNLNDEQVLAGILDLVLHGVLSPAGRRAKD